MELPKPLRPVGLFQLNLIDQILLKWNPYSGTPSWFGAIVLATGLVLVGCVQFKGNRDVRDAGPDSSWRPIPIEMRIYPSTRFVRRGDQITLESRIELIDQMGDPTKGAGRVRFELYANRHSKASGRGERLYVWEVALLTLAQQRKFFDPITRGYLFPLKLDDPGIADRATLLRVVFTPSGGHRLETEGMLKRDQIQAPSGLQR